MFSRILESNKWLLLEKYYILNFFIFESIREEGIFDELEVLEKNDKKWDEIKWRIKGGLDFLVISFVI